MVVVLQDLPRVCSVSTDDCTGAQTETQWTCLASLTTVCISLVKPVFNLRIRRVNSFDGAEELTFHAVIKVPDETSVALVGDLAI